jgi:hypothetical protein
MQKIVEYCWFGRMYQYVYMLVWIYACTCVYTCILTWRVVDYHRCARAYQCEDFGNILQNHQTHVSSIQASTALVHLNLM